MKTKLTTEQIECLYNWGLNVINLDEMLSVLPKKITDRRKVYNLLIETADCLDGKERWYISYRNTLDVDELDSHQSAEELCDAVYDMIVWVRTNNVREL